MLTMVHKHVRIIGINTFISSCMVDKDIDFCSGRDNINHGCHPLGGECDYMAL